MMNSTGKPRAHSHKLKGTKNQEVAQKSEIAIYRSFVDWDLFKERYQVMPQSFRDKYVVSKGQNGVFSIKRKLTNVK